MRWIHLSKYTRYKLERFCNDPELLELCSAFRDRRCINNAYTHAFWLFYKDYIQNVRSNGNMSFLQKFYFIEQYLELRLIRQMSHRHTRTLAFENVWSSVSVSAKGSLCSGCHLTTIRLTTSLLCTPPIAIYFPVPNASRLLLSFMLNGFFPSQFLQLPESQPQLLMPLYPHRFHHSLDNVSHLLAPSTRSALYCFIIKWKISYANGSSHLLHNWFT